jgi:hypothetical protein
LGISASVLRGHSGTLAQPNAASPGFNSYRAPWDDSEMDEVEARAILGSELAALRVIPHATLVERLLDRQETKEVVGASGAWYQIELQAFWDSQPDGALRVMGAIDDGRSPRVNFPLTADFILARDGSFIGE